MANQGVPGFESPIQLIAITLTFIKGPKVNRWVEAMLHGIEQLCPIEDNVECAYTNFLNQFSIQFADSTKQETAQATLDRHQFKFPFIDQYISNFETLIRKAGYTALFMSKERRTCQLMPYHTPMRTNDNQKRDKSPSFPPKCF